METIIAPSILAADWGNFANEVKAVDEAGADWIHIDVMDGQFVPPITFGADLVKALRGVTKKTLDVHLMINNPENQLEAFAKAGADLITVHQEVCPHLHRTLQSIKELGVKAGVAVNPSTPISTLESVIDVVDLILIMTVNPGWGGQKYIETSDQKISNTKALIESSGREIHLEVDGGVTKDSAPRCLSSGANVLVAGTAIFAESNYQAAISAIRGAG